MFQMDREAKAERNAADNRRYWRTIGCGKRGRGRRRVRNLLPSRREKIYIDTEEDANEHVE